MNARASEAVVPSPVRHAGDCGARARLDARSSSRD
ncbi:hypothetical protein BDSB_13730 [Burkholderia dolosa PC543]|nr:hypothetical protein BDSB_13730 [Burkholderia dolosa PC543]